MTHSVNGPSPNFTLTITSEPIQQFESISSDQNFTHRPDHSNLQNLSNLQTQNNSKNGLQNLTQIIGQLAGAMQCMDPKMAAFRLGLNMMGNFANQLSNQNGNSYGFSSDASNNFDNYGGTDDLISSLLGFDDDYDYDDMDEEDDQDVSSLLNSLSSLFENRSQANNGCGHDCNSTSQNDKIKKQQQAKTINDLIGGLSNGLSNGTIPPQMSGNVNQLIGQLANQANHLSPTPNPASGFSPGLSLAITLLRK